MRDGKVLFEENRVERGEYSSQSLSGGMLTIGIGTRPVRGYCVRLLRFENCRTFYVLDAQRYSPDRADGSRLLDLETDADAIREAVAVADIYRGAG